MRKVYHNIIQIAGNVITVEADNVAYNDLAEVSSGDGNTSLAQVIRIQDGKVYLQVFAGSRGISTNDEVRFLGHPMKVSSSADLLGRVFTGSGEPRDGRPAIHDDLINIGGPSVLGTESLTGAKISDGFQQIGLSLGIITHDQIDTGVEFQLQLPVIPEIL